MLTWVDWTNGHTKIPGSTGLVNIGDESWSWTILQGPTLYAAIKLKGKVGPESLRDCEFWVRKQDIEKYILDQPLLGQRIGTVFFPFLFFTSVSVELQRERENAPPTTTKKLFFLFAGVAMCVQTLIRVHITWTFPSIQGL